MHVIRSVTPVSIPATEDLDARLYWLGADDRGVELETVALDCPRPLSSSTSCPPRYE